MHLPSTNVLPYHSSSSFIKLRKDSKFLSLLKTDILFNWSIHNYSNNNLPNEIYPDLINFFPLDKETISINKIDQLPNLFKNIFGAVLTKHMY